MLVKAALKGPIALLLHRMRRKRDDRLLIAHAPQSPDSFVTIHFRHLDIHQHETEIVIQSQVHRLPPVIRRHDGRPDEFQDPLDQSLIIQTVIDH